MKAIKNKAIALRHQGLDPELYTALRHSAEHNIDNNARPRATLLPVELNGTAKHDKVKNNTIKLPVLRNPPVFCNAINTIGLFY